MAAQRAARWAVKPWSVRTRAATRRAGLDGPRCAPCYDRPRGPITTRRARIAPARLRPTCGLVAVGLRQVGLTSARRAVALCHLRLAPAVEQLGCLLLDFGRPPVGRCGARKR